VPGELEAVVAEEHALTHEGAGHPEHAPGRTGWRRTSRRRILNQVVEYQPNPGSETGLDRTFAALADPTRRALLARLDRGPATVSELAEPFEMSLAAVSKHLRVLERAGLLRRHVKGREHHCSLDAAPLVPAVDFAASYVRSWEQRLDALEGYLRRKGRGRKPAARGGR